MSEFPPRDIDKKQESVPHQLDDVPSLEFAPQLSIEVNPGTDEYQNVEERQEGEDIQNIELVQPVGQGQTAAPEL
jgi:hypothetical protein